MKITGIETFVVDCYRTNWIFVEVRTDEGIVGVGEGSIEYREHTVCKAIEELSPILIGADPFAIEGLHMLMQRESYWWSGPILSTAISAVELALWDIKGKALGVPVYQLLGGKVRDRIPVYANGWFAGARTGEQFAEKACSIVEQGFRGLKLDPFGQAYLSMTTAELNESIGKIAKIRDAVGPDIDIMVEAHGRFNVMTAIEVGRALKDFRIRWLEEPTVPERNTAIAQVRKATQVPIAAGERSYSRFDFGELLACEAVDVIQPDICHVSGLLEMKRIAALADTELIPVAPHNANGAVCHAAGLHFAASCNNFMVLETFAIDVPWRREMTTEDWTFQDGCLLVPETPGLGVELRKEALCKHPYKQHSLRHFTGKLTDIRPPDSCRWF
ncbi:MULTISPECIES: galactonate dehydratase [unclassified Mesorhizobium]|uniref:galactonate dehydratase n=1 Tax=unclassified Mesorhizobium TaxID=325217 RepID=UPI00112E81E4|nr:MULTISPECIES: galactonate dehydratase [unclassified Mesorhizobium]MBZ9894368.1 galactonate dehydratase [Mesorhizobium sp. BR1-1-6]TPM57673.1 galactonate dehydratase [Mesorhizobium sp. B2-2-4]TPM65524.1 galactonate dehydratase [Mesorhizobium sp. B2-2-1]TPM98499.1 galactonate dehydratase [Mesorhizobium sp. B2-1-5]TPN38566.1 galactonate dehydratase [Mesorhizobium sp. B1-1-6]